MTLQQQLADRVGGLSDEGVKLVEQLLDGMNPRFFVVKLDRDGESQKEKNIQLLSEMMAYQTKEDDDIVKRIIRIPAEKKADYIRHLDFLGINKARLFPENWDLQCEIVKDEVM